MGPTQWLFKRHWACAQVPSQWLPHLWQVGGVICTDISKTRGSAKLGGPSKAKQLVSGGGIPHGSVRAQSPLPPLHTTLKFSGTPETRAEKHDLLPVWIKRQVPRPGDYPGCGCRQQYHTWTEISKILHLVNTSKIHWDFCRSIPGALR